MNDEAKINQTIQNYFDSMFESNPEKVHLAFHPDAKIVGYLQGDLHAMGVAEFAEFVAGQQPSPKANNEVARLDVLSIEIAGKTAVARIRDDYLGMTFLDTLSLLNVDDQWWIYNKLFHVEN